MERDLDMESKGRSPIFRMCAYAGPNKAFQARNSEEKVKWKKGNITYFGLIQYFQGDRHIHPTEVRQHSKSWHVFAVHALFSNCRDNSMDLERFPTRDYLK